MVEVITTDEFAAWYRSLLDQSQIEEVAFLVDLLEHKGVTLGHPYSSALKGTDFAFRELRGSAGKSELRIVYAFDPSRDAVLIVGGDKSGDKNFYERIIALAEKVWREYLGEQGFDKQK
jgi:hypothetical protein